VNDREASAAPAGRCFDVGVVGAGAIGASVALELTRRGAKVLVIDQGDGWAAGCSAGNAGLLVPSHAGHFATRSDLARAAVWALRRDSPFGFRPRPALVPFLRRLLPATGEAAARKTRDLLESLALESLEMHATLGARGVDTGFTRNGVVEIYETRRGFAHGAAVAADPGRRRMDPSVVSGPELAELEPAVQGALAGGVVYPHEAHLDPRAYVTAVGSAAQAAGACFAPGNEVKAVRRVAGSVVIDASRGQFRANVVVIAAGAWSAQIGRTVSGAPPLEAGKGYSIDLELERAGGIRRPLLLREARVAVTPLGDRLRLAGTMQFDGLRVNVDHVKANAIRAATERVLPITELGHAAATWAGLRPCTPDGLPLIGPLGAEPGLIICAGHAMLGLTLAPISAQLVADFIEGRDSRERARLDPARFGSR
jgi:D-amino-acid dehydrogenase